MELVTHIINVVYDTAVPHSVGIFNAFIGGAGDIFSAFVGVWMVYQLLVNVMIKNKGSMDMVHRLFIFLCISSVLHGADAYLSNFVFPALRMVNSLLIETLESGLGDNFIGGGSVDSMDALLMAVDECLSQILRILKETSRYGSFVFDFVNHLLTWLAIAPAFFSGIMFACFVAEYILKVTAFIALSPFLLICLAFPSTAHMFKAGCQVVLQSIVVMFLGLIVITMCIDLIYSSLGELVDLEGDEYADAMKAWLLSEDYFSCFICSAVGGYFMTKVHTIASNIVGGSDSSTAATVVSAAGTAAYMGAGKYGLKGGLKAGGSLAGSALGSASKIGKAMWKIFK